jgi:hypothetical protein
MVVGSLLLSPPTEPSLVPFAYFAVKMFRWFFAFVVPKRMVYLVPVSSTLRCGAKGLCGSIFLFLECVMKNVEMKVEGNILTIKVDLSKEFGPSSSGKTIIVASTEGNISIPDRDEKVGLNVYKKK